MTRPGGVRTAAEILAAVPVDYDLAIDRSTPRVSARVDEVAVQRAISSGAEPVRLNRAERQAVIAALAAKGWADRQIAERVRLDPYSVLRNRRALGIQSRWSA